MAAAQLEEGDQPSSGHPGCGGLGRLEMPAGAPCWWLGMEPCRQEPVWRRGLSCSTCEPLRGCHHPLCNFPAPLVASRGPPLELLPSGVLLLVSLLMWDMILDKGMDGAPGGVGVPGRG